MQTIKLKAFKCDQSLSWNHLHNHQAFLYKFENIQVKIYFITDMRVSKS